MRTSKNLFPLVSFVLALGTYFLLCFGWPYIYIYIYIYILYDFTHKKEKEKKGIHLQKSHEMVTSSEPGKRMLTGNLNENLPKT